MSAHSELLVFETDRGFVINRAAVMALAWRLHRRDLQLSAEDGEAPFGFGWHLRDAWQKARSEMHALEYARASLTWTPEQHEWANREMVDRGWRPAA